MIQITRSLARQLKSIFRRAIIETGRGSVFAPVLFHAGPEGLRIRIASGEVAAEYHDPSPREPDAAIVPFEFLKDCEAKSDAPVQIEMATGDRVMATWDERQVPQLKHYDIPTSEHVFPDWPSSFSEKHLRRAIDLGFREIHVFAPDQPLLCVGDRRKYLWAVLTPSEAIKPSDDAVRICSTSDPAATTNSTTQTQEEITVAKQQDTTTRHEQQTHSIGSTEELIDAAEQLKASLRDTLGKTSVLIAGLKRHRKEAKIVRTTLDSLRQLQTVGYSFTDDAKPVSW